jgi:hypothetical protein
VGAGASCFSRVHGDGNQASASRAIAGASSSRSSRSPSQPPVFALSAPVNGSPPKRRCIDSWWMNGGASAGSSPVVSSGGATSGIGDSSNSGPRQGTENEATVSAIGWPSCSRRAVTVLSERPVRSTLVRTEAGAAVGGRRKVTVSERAGRPGSPSSRSIAASTIAIT